MNVYHETTMELLRDPDMSLGYTYQGTKLVAHHDAVEEISHYEVMQGTEDMNNGKGLQGKVIDTPRQEAWDEYEDCSYYHPYTKEELEKIEKNNPDNLASWEDLAAAYNEGVMQA